MHKTKLMLKNIFNTFLFCCFGSGVFAQSGNMVLNGSISINNGSTYKYKLVVADSQGNWNGYSVLDESGPNETKSSITLKFIKEKKALLFTEKKLISSKSGETTFCSIGGLMKMNDKKTGVKGIFMGRDEKNKFCGSGSVKLSLPKEAVALMTPDGTKDTNTASLVTSFKSESFKVSNARIQLEIWDGGLQDHDSISVSLNNEIILPAFEIANEKRIVTLNLKKGENILKIKALNEGDEAPNSARIGIIDQNSKYSVVSFLNGKEEATVKIKL